MRLGSDLVDKNAKSDNVNDHRAGTIDLQAEKVHASPASRASYCYHAIGRTNTRSIGNSFEARFALSARFVPVGFDYPACLFVNQVDSVSMLSAQFSLGKGTIQDFSIQIQSTNQFFEDVAAHLIMSSAHPVICVAVMLADHSAALQCERDTPRRT